MHRRAGLACNRGVTLDQFKQLARLSDFVDYEIKIFSSTPSLEQILHLNEYGCEGPLCLYLDREWHLYVIKSVNALFGKVGAMCTQCNKFFTGHSRKHTCDRYLFKQCKCRCDVFSDVNAVPCIKCDDCGRYFMSSTCYDLHLKRVESEKRRENIQKCL